jgi:hypothetical protein
MEKLVEAMSGEVLAGLIAMMLALIAAIGVAGKALIGRAQKLGEAKLEQLKLEAEVAIARLEHEKLQLAAAAGARIAEVATMPASAIRGEAKKALAVEQAAELLGVSSHAAAPAALPDAVQAAYERDEERRSLSPDALTPAETPTAKLRRI